MRSIATILALLAGIIAASGCDALIPPAPDESTLLDGPLDGLTPEQLSIFMKGDEEFGRIFGAGDGLGPIFIANSCSSCHVGDGKGHPVFAITRFGQYTGETFDPMEAHGGPQLQNRAIAGYPPEVLPKEATAIARFIPPAVTGLGFLEAVDDATILAMSDPSDRDGDGISGVPSLIDSTDFIAPLVEEVLAAGTQQTRNVPVEGKYIGRFGRKARTVNLLHQTVFAYVDDIGLTTDFVTEDLYNVQVGHFATDDVPDPEVPSNTVRNVVFYLRTLKVPPRRNADDPDVTAGEALFRQINCSGCHVPTLKTGRSDVEALSEKEFHPYTDLLLHDMGPELDDGYTEGSARSSEWRTTPLWGIGLSADAQGGQAFYMHDGRAKTLREAVALHGGEAARSREAFDKLTREEQEQIITFLKSL